MPFQFSKLLRWVRQTVADPSGIWRYGFAVVAVLAATGVRLAFNPVVSVYAPTVLFMLALTVAAWFAGRGPGLGGNCAQCA